ncbi:ATP-dependent DNA helicase RecQ [Arboricoccus pini]|uniref:DNA helicase RecQ n=1 Tax=Arboricoccus pini TaxID=1963835 RepID=A0A212QQJ6_9PROT|nr:DNA helicase RecQ [Arboricoccus pini]SNB61601.1 ATP-dependent DNA helicase RecQ [Arboricoccus pini]
MPNTRMREVLSTTFGYAAFRPGQQALVEAIVDGQDVLAVMPTGAGKSLCYQLPALLSEGTTLVISPLVALMRDQVSGLERLGIEAGALSSGQDAAGNREVASRFQAGALKLLYLAPERLALPGTLDLLRRAPLARLAVDEAHCVSQWGHDFRPDYLRIREVADELGNGRSMQLVAFTATADPGTREEIARRLFPVAPKIVVHGFDRPNISVAMEPKREVRRQIRAFIAGHAGESGIVYASSRRKTEELAAALVQDGIRAEAYHAGLDSRLRGQRQERFQREDGMVMVATVAFGMGIDKPDVRFVAHADMPRSVEAYYQEIGRAGRDGLPAETLSLYGLDDMRLRRLQIEQSEGSAEFKRVEQQRLAALIALMETPRCRWQTIRGYFGETAEPCGHCDVCRHGITAADATQEARMVLSAILRTEERFGTEHLIDILVGHATEKVCRFGHDRLPTFGVGKDRSRDAWRGVVRQLYGAGLITTDLGGHGSWRMEADARSLLKGETRFEVRADIFTNRKPLRKSASPHVTDDLDVEEQLLFERLRAKRREIATDEEVPAYVVFPDRTLKEMARLRPRSLAEMGEVNGVGAAKLARYGRAFLEALDV